MGSTLGFQEEPGPALRGDTVCRAADAAPAAGARQLRAPGRRLRRAGRGAAARLPALRDPGDQPRAARRRRRDRPGACRRWRVPTASDRPPLERAARVRRGAPVRRAGAAGASRLRSADRAHARRRSRASAAGSTASRWRSSWPRRALRVLSVDADRRAPGRPLPAAHRRQPDRAAAPADAAGDARLELRPAGREPSSGCSTGWPSSPAAGRWRRPRPSAATASIGLVLDDAGSAGGEVAGGGGGRGVRRQSLPNARDDPPVRRGAPAGSGEAPLLRERHFRWFVQLGLEAEQGMRFGKLPWSTRKRWVERMHIEMANLRAAWQWPLDGEGSPRLGLALAAGLFALFWTGMLSEGIDCYTALLERDAALVRAPNAPGHWPWRARSRRNMATTICRCVGPRSIGRNQLTCARRGATRSCTRR